MRSSGSSSNRDGENPDPDPEPDRIERLFREGTEIDEAIAQAVRHALLIHKKLGNPIAIWRDGKVVWIPPDEIPVDEP